MEKRERRRPASLSSPPSPPSPAISITSLTVAHPGPPPTFPPLSFSCVTPTLSDYFLFTGNTLKKRQSLTLGISSSAMGRSDILAVAGYLSFPIRKKGAR